jgi:hypothetical protein
MTHVERNSIEHVTTFGDKQIYHIQSSYGGVEVIFTPDDRIYQIANFDVSERRQGHGKNLLRTSAEHAEALGARAVIAAIISRECLDAMSSVFGQEHIEIDALGEYAPGGLDSHPDSPTSAMLYKSIDTK